MPRSAAGSAHGAVFAALGQVGINAEPVFYGDDVLDPVRARLGTSNGAFVWVNSIQNFVCVLLAREDI